MSVSPLLPNNSIYHERILEIKQNVTQYIENALPLLNNNFASNQIFYAKEVEKNLEAILKDNKVFKLSEQELFFAISSIWLNHLGLIQGMFKEDLTQIPIDIIRRTHHIRSERLIVNNYKAFGLHESETVILGLLVRFHTVTIDLSDCPEKIVHETIQVRIRLLAALLRLAILLYIPGRCRTPYKKNVPARLYKKSSISYLTQELTTGFEINYEKKSIIIHFIRPSQIDPSDKYIFNKAINSLNVFYDIIKANFIRHFFPIKDVFLKEGITSLIEVESQVNDCIFNNHKYFEIMKLLEYDKLDIKLEIDENISSLIICVESFNNLYNHICKLLNVSTTDYPMIVKNIETGSLLLDLIGGQKAIGFLKELLGYFLSLADKKYTTKGKISTIDEISNAVNKIIDTKVKLNELGIATPETDDDLKNISMLISKELNILTQTITTAKFQKKEYLISNQKDTT